MDLFCIVPSIGGCPLALYLYVLTADALGYLLEASHIVRQIHSILLSDDLETVNNHFVDESLLSVRVEWDSIDGALPCLDTCCSV